MQVSFWWWQCSDRYILSLSPPPPYPLPPFSPSLISLVSVDVKHHVYFIQGHHGTGELWIAERSVRAYSHDSRSCPPPPPAPSTPSPLQPPPHTHTHTHTPISNLQLKIGPVGRGGKNSQAKTTDLFHILFVTSLEQSAGKQEGNSPPKWAGAKVGVLVVRQSTPAPEAGTRSEQGPVHSGGVASHWKRSSSGLGKYFLWVKIKYVS